MPGWLDGGPTLTAQQTSLTDIHLVGNYAVSPHWGDGHHTLYEATPLRWLCPCAFCRGEAGMPGWLDGGPTLTAEQTRLTDIHLVGNYAVSPHWGDGHHTGFYTFRLLRERCPCEECTARRSESAHHHE